MMVRSALSCSEAEDAIQRELAARRADRRGQAARAPRSAPENDGEMPTGLDPADYARYIMTMLEGMSVRAAGGATRKDLHKIADMALRTWPA